MSHLLLAHGLGLGAKEFAFLAGVALFGIGAVGGLGFGLYKLIAWLVRIL